MLATWSTRCATEWRSGGPCRWSTTCDAPSSDGSVTSVSEQAVPDPRPRAAATLQSSVGEAVGKVDERRDEYLGVLFVQRALGVVPRRPHRTQVMRKLELHAAAFGEVHRVARIEAAQVRRDRVEVVDDEVVGQYVAELGRRASVTSARFAPPTSTRLQAVRAAASSRGPRRRVRTWSRNAASRGASAGSCVDRRHVALAGRRAARPCSTSARRAAAASRAISAVPGSSPPWSARNPTARAQHQLLDDLGMGEQFRERHRMTVARRVGPAAMVAIRAPCSGGNVPTAISCATCRRPSGSCRTSCAAGTSRRSTSSSRSSMRHDRRVRPRVQRRAPDDADQRSSTS